MDLGKMGGLAEQMAKSQGGNDPMESIKGMFAGSDNGQQVSAGDFQEMVDCAAMLEKYVHLFPKRKDCPTFEGDDMRRWKTGFYPKLVQNGPKLLDDKFYSGSDNPSNLGIGTDGGFSGEELFQFLYRLYKAIAGHKLQSSDMKKAMELKDLLSCSSMLEKYVDKFPKTKGCVKFAGDDMRLWKENYYPNLVQKGPKLLDDKFFTGSDSPSNWGIGTDGEFSAYELFQFLYRLYKEIAKQLG